MADVTVANTTAALSGDTLLTAEDDYTITGLLTYDNDPGPPFAVSAASSVVTNLNADLLDGIEASAFVVQAQDGSAATPAIQVRSSDNGMYSSAVDTVDFATNGTRALTIDSTQFIDSPTQPRCVAYHNTTQTIATTTTTSLLLNSEVLDVGTMHDLVTNNSRITIPTGGDGLYLVIGRVQTDGSVSSGNLFLSKTGTAQVGRFFIGGQQAPMLVVWVGTAVATDYFELLIAQNAATSTVYGSATAADANRLSLVKLW